MTTLFCRSSLAVVLMACAPLPAVEVVPTRAAPGAAGTDTSAISFMVGRTSYRSGEQVSLALVNHTNATYTFNPCTRWVERQEDDRWVMVQEPDRVCLMMAWLLDPHGTRDAQTELPAGLASGTYRMVLNLVREGSPPDQERVRVVSRPFTVAVSSSR